jgi:hypothetical protein
MESWWTDVADEVHATTYGEPTERDQRVAQAAVAGVRRRAERRAVMALIRGNPALEQAWHLDPAFHAVFTQVIQIVVAGVFGEMPLSRVELEERVKLLKQFDIDVQELLGGFSGQAS